MKQMYYAAQKRSISMLLLLCSLVSTALAQQNINGKITDETGGPLPGATVVIKGTTKGNVSDIDGLYSISASTGDVLTYTFIGYETREITLQNQTTLDIQLVPTTASLEEVVVVGYGTQTKKEITGAVANIKSDLIEKAPVSDIGQALQGQVAGVNVQAASGRPGEASNIQIRGVGSLLGTLEPLYVVDGVPYQNNPNIAPEQIESIDILKDGAAASIYGTRASNGVVLITTKRGKKGKIKVDFSAYGGIQNITSGTPLMNTSQQMYAEEVSLEALGRDPLIFFFSPNALDYDSDFVADVQNNNAAIQNYSIGITGGTDELAVNFTSNYFDQEGILINSGFDRLSSRLNVQFNKGKFKAFASLALTEENREQEPWSLYEYAIAQNPWQPPLGGLSSQGNDFELPADNPILYSYLSRELNNIDNRTINSNNIALNLEYEFFEGLSFKVNLGTNQWNYRRKFFRPQYLVYTPEGDYSPTASREDALLNEDYTFTRRNVMENILRYSKTINKHNIELTGVASYEKFTSEQIGVGIIGLLSNDTPVLGAGQQATKPSSYDYTNTLSGLMARGQYNYDDRYLFSASYRRDGSSNFGPNNKYGDFFGASAGWNISEEAFFKNAQLSFVDNLKIRGSWAEVGNQSIPAYTYASLIESGVNYLFSKEEILANGAIQRRYANPNVKWESSISTNIGLDLSLFQGKLNFTADYYKNDKQDMLLPRVTPPSGGAHHPGAVDTYSPIIVNAGNMTNQGVELSLNYKNETSKGLKYGLTGTFTRNRNKITNLNGINRGYANGRPTQSLGPNVDYTTYFAVGYEAGAFFLTENAGVIKTEEQLANYQAIEPSAQLGDMMYVDQLTEDSDGDGIPDTGNGTIDENDRVYKGSGQSKFEAGINFNLAYKNVDFYLQNYISYGAKLYNGARMYAYTQGRHLDQYHQWSPQNPNSDIASYRGDYYHNNVRARSDFFLEDGSYWRIRNITIGYTLPSSVMDKLKLTKARVYATGMNPFTFTKYTGYDPEVGGNGISTRGVDQGNYPVSRRFIMGIQIQF
ncbi:TonB-dependent receptor [Echinicola strongylocentroti]|uniref:TonB-dependent receptor n=1 Tax=Echinicola strongylocentroti TaxID=1795355 RepID=A0A2Z4IEK5_9BACT|nr:TonB-dependent receptor [Echinicola strongylocentroti]AWW29521.1 TonB-dependent receptor [Echinicola strongylocentroti]